MRTIRNANRMHYRCATLLAIVALAVIAPRARAGSVAGTHASHTGNERFEATDVAGGHVSAGSSSSTVSLDQWFETWTDESAWKYAFVFWASARHRGGVGSTDVRLRVRDEFVLPPSHGNEFTLRGSYPGSKTGLPFDSFYHFAGLTSVAVGDQAYNVFATWYIRLDFDLAGHAYALNDTTIEGRFDTTRTHYFYAHLPENVVLESAERSQLTPDSDSWFNRQDLSPWRVSGLSCKLRANGSSLVGNWCRFQQDPLELRARLIHTATLGGLTFTEIIPVVEDDAPAVDRYLIDKRPQPWLRPLRR